MEQVKHKGIIEYIQRNHHPVKCLTREEILKMTAKEFEKIILDDLEFHRRKMELMIKEGYYK